MKSLKGKIVRVSDERASELYQEGFKYLPKSEWKEDTRKVDTKSKKNKSRKTLQVFNKYIVLTTILFLINNILVWSTSNEKQLL